MLADYAAGNRALARRRFGRDRLFLEPLPSWRAGLDRMRLPATGDKLMDELVAPFLGELIREWQEEDARQAAKAKRDDAA